MIKNVIFDMGNVLLRFDRETFMDRVEVSGEDRAILMDEVYMSLEWAMMDRGSLSEEEAADRMCARLPERLREKAHLLVDQWDRPILPVPGMAELVKELKDKGYGVYLLSNASRRQHEYWPEVPGSELFDGTVISADIGLVKPQPEIYLYTLSCFGLKCDECVFVDDAIINAEGAVYCGIPAIVFRGDSRRLRRELQEMGVDVQSLA